MSEFKGRRSFLVGLALAASAVSLGACSAVEGRETTGQYVDDATITAKVKTKILQDPNLKVMQINVETMQGEVQLSGFVDSSTTAAHAAEVARSVDGVKSVKNSLVVRSS